MGFQDRDYYKDAWKKRDRGDIHGYHYGGFKKNQNPETSKIQTSESIWPFFKVLFRYIWIVYIVAMALRLLLIWVKNPI